MSLSFCSFASGSSGNCYLVKTRTTSILIDAGISAKRIMRGLERTSTPKESVAALLVTHEHTDHVSGLAPTLNCLKTAEIAASEGTFENLRTGVGGIASDGIASSRIASNRKRTVSAGDGFTVGDIEISVFGLQHDAAEPVGFTLAGDGGGVSVVTDTGVFTEEILSAVCDSDIIALESNHDVGMLKNGRYPGFLKQRVLGESGHLSNVQAANAICEIMGMDRKPRCMLLSHLSRDNNRPKLAEATVLGILGEMGWYSGRDLFVKSLPRDRMSVIFEV